MRLNNNQYECTKLKGAPEKLGHSKEKTGKAIM